LGNLPKRAQNPPDAEGQGRHQHSPPPVSGSSRRARCIVCEIRKSQISRMLNATQIARLLCRSVPWAWRRLDAGSYGEPMRRGGRSVWVPIVAVEQAEGVTFSPEQLVAVGVLAFAIGEAV
jgi:hypothetical protein